MTSPLERYQALVASNEFRADPDQALVVEHLDTLFNTLVRQPEPRWWRPREPAPRGLYLWGGVGRGKTWLMDLFHEALPFDEKLRIHFHRFMARVHEALRERRDERDPLPEIAQQWARQYRVLCFDEFFVADIADAMLLGGLLEALFKEGVTLVTTSNIAPDDLYRDGLQRTRFLPAIECIKQHTQVIAIAGDVDFRLRLLQKSEIYHFPLDAGADPALNASFERMSGGCELRNKLIINHRELSARRRGDGIIWFSFETLCKEPRSTLDYIEIARAFNTVLISGVEVLTEDTADTARRFINLVDEFYDHNVKLLISAEAAIDDLYQGQRLAFEFERTRSRLTEMQSHDYLARPHLP